jgi:5-methylcytosine-specific restriction endonuclease McrA
MVERRCVYASVVVADFSALDIFRRDGWTCGICGDPIARFAESPAPLSPSVDHIVPLAWGGEHSRRNVRAAHLVCNTTKRDGGNLVALMAAA